jgi:hypothetical protein
VYLLGVWIHLGKIFFYDGDVLRSAELLNSNDHSGFQAELFF